MRTHHTQRFKSLDKLKDVKHVCVYSK